jgi:hypothetical protein
MNNTSVIQSLRQEASSNKISADIFLCLGLRERARNDVTVTGLAARMKEDGFDYPEAEYARFIRFLANLQLGTLKTDSKGRAVAIQDIRLTLQSIGQAALGERHSFLAWKQRKRYIKLLTPNTPPAKPSLPTPTVKVQAPRIVAKPAVLQAEVSITITVGGKPVQISMPKGLTPSEIAEFLTHFQSI